MKVLVKNKFNNIGAAIINSRKDIDLDLIDKSRKKIYRETLKEDDDSKWDLDNDVMDKLIYIFSQIKYTKIKTYKRYIYICQYIKGGASRLVSWSSITTISSSKGYSAWMDEARFGHVPGHVQVESCDWGRVS